VSYAAGGVSIRVKRSLVVRGIIALRISSDSPGALSFSATLRSPRDKQCVAARAHRSE